MRVFMAIFFAGLLAGLALQPQAAAQSTTAREMARAGYPK